MCGRTDDRPRAHVLRFFENYKVLCCMAGGAFCRNRLTGWDLRNATCMVTQGSGNKVAVARSLPRDLSESARRLHRDGQAAIADREYKASKGATHEQIFSN